MFAKLISRVVIHGAIGYEVSNGKLREYFSDFVKGKNCCDSATGWISNNLLSEDTSDKQEGSSSLKSVGSGTVQFAKAFSNPVNSSVTEEHGVFQFWYYISDTNKFDGTGRVEITSSGTSDTDEYNWNIEKHIKPYIKDGWNLISLNLKEANKIGSPNLASINYFRMFQNVNGNITTKIDKIEVRSDLNVISTFDTCNNISGWTAAIFTMSPTKYAYLPLLTMQKFIPM